MSRYDEQPETEIEDNRESVAVVVADLKELLYFNSDTVGNIVEALRSSAGFTGGYLVQEHAVDNGYFKRMQDEEVLVRGCYEFVNYVRGNVSTCFFTRQHS